ncbi:TerB family tellurite resistance protein [uncultured Polaribacter sp.]|uniref:tellurite resistance TerB family protein n=1 Tax=uncultured Polaribacter sp. TaxID=174711 RepID=UPI0026254E12|nr:TerB family tellurite resistance protein [uncultured Polaribacter sp.]
MGLSEIYTNGKQKQNRGHFANIVKIAKADHKITIEEEHLLLQIAKRLNISQSSFIKILENPEKYPINPPGNSEERITRLHGLTQMVLVDGEVAEEEVKLMRKIAIGLGFSSKNLDGVCEKAIALVKTNIDLEGFITEIKKVNRA